MIAVKVKVEYSDIVSPRNLNIFSKGNSHRWGLEGEDTIHNYWIEGKCILREKSYAWGGNFVNIKLLGMYLEVWINIEISYM